MSEPTPPEWNIGTYPENLQLKGFSSSEWISPMANSAYYETTTIFFRYLTQTEADTLYTAINNIWGVPGSIATRIYARLGLGTIDGVPGSALTQIWMTREYPVELVSPKDFALMQENALKMWAENYTHIMQGYISTTPPPPPPSCNVNSDCPEGYVCINGECFYAGDNIGIPLGLIILGGLALTAVAVYLWKKR